MQYLIHQDRAFKRIDSIKKELAKNIKKHIKEKKLTQKQAAEIVGIAYQRIGEIIRGELDKWSLDRVMMVAISLNVQATITLATVKNVKKENPSQGQS